MKLLPNNIPALLIGSAAAKFWWPDFRDPVDYDAYCINKKLTRKIKESGFDVEYDAGHKGIKGLVNHTKTSPVIEINGLKLPVASPRVLLTIKAIHINYPSKWRKNINDYIILQQLVREDPYPELIAARTAYLDSITKIHRYLKTPSGFWDIDPGCRHELLSGESLRKWCIYSIDARLRRYIQVNFRDLYEKINVAAGTPLVGDV